MWPIGQEVRAISLTTRPASDSFIVFVLFSWLATVTAERSRAMTGKCGWSASS